MYAYVLFYDSADGFDRESWNTFYTPVEVFDTSDARQKRMDHLKSKYGRNVSFHKMDVTIFSESEASTKDYFPYEDEGFVPDEDD